MLEGEGAFVMEDYFDRGLRDLCVRVAPSEGIPMRRGMRATTSTDSVIPSRMGIPTLCLTSLNRHKALANYHSMADMPENLSWNTVACRRRPRRGADPPARETRVGRGPSLPGPAGREMIAVRRKPPRIPAERSLTRGRAAVRSHPRGSVCQSDQRPFDPTFG